MKPFNDLIKEKLNGPIILLIIISVLILIIIPLLVSIYSLFVVIVVALMTISLFFLLYMQLDDQAGKLAGIVLFVGFIFLSILGYQEVSSLRGPMLFKNTISIIELIIGGITLGSAIFIIYRNGPVKTTENKKYDNLLYNYRYEIALFILVVIGFYIRLININFSFYQDEFFHLNTAVGFLKTGKLAQWNFVKETIGGSYLRGIPISLQAALTFKLFGVNELIARITPMFWGLLLIPAAYWFGYFFSKDKIVSLLLASIIVFDPIFFQASRYLRVYSMFSVLFLVFIVFTYKALEENNKLNYVIAFLLLIATFFTQQIVLVSLVGIFLYVIYRFIQKYSQSGSIYNRYSVIILTIILGSIILLIINYLHGSDFVGLNFIELNTRTYYLDLTFDIFPILAASILFIVGIFSNTKDNRLVYLSFVVLISIYFFTFWSGRYAAKFYIINILPVVYLFVVMGLKSLWKKKTYFKYASMIFIVVIFANMAVWHVDYHTKEAYLKPDYIGAYEYLQNNCANDNSILFLSPQTYYLDKAGKFKCKIEELPINKELTLDNLKEKVDRSKKVYLIYQNSREHHFRREVLLYIKKNFKKISSISNKTGFEIYKVNF